MTTIDIAISTIVAIGVIRGFLKGFIYEIAILGTLVVAYFLGFKMAAIAAVYIGKIISVNPLTLHYISLFTAWIGISIGIFFLAKLFEGLVKIAALGIFNKIAGAVFGGLKYIFLLSLFFYFFNRYNISTTWLNADKKAESHFYYPILKISTMVFSFLEKQVN